MEVNDLGIKGMETLPLVLEYLYDVASSLCVCYTSAKRKHLLIITNCVPVFPSCADQYFWNS